MQNIKGAIFDMDGTLLDSMPVWKRLTQNYLKQFDLHITDRGFRGVRGLFTAAGRGLLSGTPSRAAADA